MNSIRFAVITCLIALPALAQESWYTPTEIDAGEAGYTTMVVDRVDATGRTISGSFADSDHALTTRISSGTAFRGFADDVAGALMGFGGLAYVQVGDRVRVAGRGVSAGVIEAADIRLVGRVVTTETRAPAQPAVLDGTIVSVNRDENRFVIRTADRNLWTIAGAGDTPVVYQGRNFSIGNLEVGDGVRVTVTRWDSSSAIPSRIEVTSDARRADPGTLTTLTGRVTATRSANRSVTLETERGDLIEVDLVAATDETGTPLRTNALAVGDQVEISGVQGTPGTFRANIVRAAGGTAGLQPFEITGSVVRPLETGGVLTVMQGDAPVGVRVHPDQPVRFRPGRWFRASELQEGDVLRLRGLAAGDTRVVQMIEVLGLDEAGSSRN